MEPIKVVHPGPAEPGETFLPYKRDEMLARPWALPGTKGLEHRIGGLEKEDGTGNISYDPKNHQHMVNTRARKVQNVAEVVGPLNVEGPEQGELLVLSWGGTYGACRTACEHARRNGQSVAHAHLRWLNPFPRNLGEVLHRYRRVLIPELNMGQLRVLINSQFHLGAKGYNKVQGKPFSVSELEAAITATLAGK
jgi:2-oxoglutarate ferredoxin oxidoreductase subunit alpha